MELDWTTFLLEVINFLILVWLLKRFLYQPVLEVIGKRRQRIQAELQQAATTRDQARDLKEQYETRLVEWEQQKRAAMERLTQEIAREREKSLRQVDEELEQLRQKHRALDRQQQVMWRSQAESGALRLGGAFAARLLRELAGPEVDQRLRQLFVEQLQALPQNELARLQEGWQGSNPNVEILSAAPLDAGQQAAIRQALEQALGPCQGDWQFDTDDKLVAGLRVSAGGWILQANLQDELQFSVRPPMADELFPLLDRQQRWLDGYHAGLRLSERGTVISVGDGIVWIKGLPSAAMDQALIFADGSTGQVFHLGEHLIGAVLLSESEALTAGTSVRLGDASVSIAVGEALLGRVIDPLGQPLDGLPPPACASRRNLEGPSPAMTERDFVKRPLYTGISLIDTLLPIGMGQRQLIIGDEGLGRTSIALDTVINQRGRNVVCVYVVVGHKRSEAINILGVLREQGALEYTTLVVAGGSALPGMKYLAPYAGCAIGEYWMRQGRDCLVIYDDLTLHARAYRELSLLLRRPPGREAYPGDIFYLHARLLERATCLAPEQGGGSLTALPIVETQQGEIASYIPTNLISITDGQIYLERNLFAGGIRPAIDVGKSVSRIGGKAQHPAIKRQAAHIKLDYLQFQELEAFTRFGARLEVKMQAKLRRGSILREMLKQNRLQPREETRLLAWLIAYNSGLLDDLDPRQARRYLENLGEQAHNWPLTLDTPLEQWQAEVTQWWADSGGRHEQTA